MADDSDAPPLPRRVPGATVSPGTPVRAERFVIPEDLRQRVLTAIADELQRDEAEERRRAQEQGKAEKAHPGEQVARAGDVLTSAGGEAGQADLQAPAPDQMDHQAAAPASTVWSPPPRPADLLPPAPGLEARQAAASAPTVWPPPPRPADLPPPAPDRAAHRASPPDQADLQAPAADRPDPQPAVPLPRRNPGRNGAPPPPAHVRRQFLPSSLLRRRLN